MIDRTIHPGFITLESDGGSSWNTTATGITNENGIWVVHGACAWLCDRCAVGEVRHEAEAV